VCGGTIEHMILQPPKLVVAAAAVVGAVACTSSLSTSFAVTAATATATRTTSMLDNDEDVVVRTAASVAADAEATDDASLLADSDEPAGSSSSSSSALQRARALKAPQPELSYGGEHEHVDWWSEHEQLLSEARDEWGRKFKELYEWSQKFEARFLDPDLVRAFRIGDRQILKSKLLEPVPGVPDAYTFQLFTPEFAQRLVEELDHHEASGVPLRRPNGMNRYGAILSELGFSNVVEHLTDRFLVPIARELFLSHVGPDDLEERYAFSVRYRPGQDVFLDEHADASAVTVNVCLEPPSSGNTKVLYFKENRSTSLWRRDAGLGDPANATYVDLAEPGRAVIHLGQHVHGVAPVDAARSQMVVWMFGRHGYVRVAPYENGEIRAHARQYDAFWREKKKRNNDRSTGRSAQEKEETTHLNEGEL